MPLGGTLLLLEFRADLALPAAGEKPCHARTTNKPTRAPIRGWRLSLKGLDGLRKTTASCPNPTRNAPGAGTERIDLIEKCHSGL